MLSPVGGGKTSVQAEQIVAKVLKYTKFSSDVSTSCKIPDAVIDYCLGSITFGSVTMLSGFVDYLKTEWKVGLSGVIGYMNALGHMLDHRRSSRICQNNLSIFIASEIYLNRVKKFLFRKMKAEWTKILSIEYLDSINCWATLAGFAESYTISLSQI